MSGRTFVITCPIVVVLFSSIFFPALPAAAEGGLFHLRDGTHVAGAYVGETKKSLILIDAGGKRHTIPLEEVLGVDWNRAEDPALRAQAIRERAKWLRERQAEARKKLEALGAPPDGDAPAITASLREFRKEELLPALIDGVRSASPPIREFALLELAAIEDCNAAVPIALGALVVEDLEFAQRAHEAAIAKDADLSRRVYEAISVRSSTKLEYRMKALDRVASIADRRSVPILLQQVEYMQSDIRLTLLRSKGFKEVTVNLGSLQQAATQVDIELPQAELISVQTSTVVPVARLQKLEAQMFAALGKISGKEFGEDLAAWQGWWAQESRKSAPNSDRSSAQPPLTGKPAPLGE